MSDEKQVLVTGASGGIGSAIAEAVAQAGYAVVAGYNRGKTRVDELIQKVKNRFDVVIPKRVPLAEAENTAQLLIDDIITPNIKA